jgi:hypothetical protein
MLIPWKVEKIDHWTTRVKVIGGWLVTITECGTNGNLAMNTTFVPDEQHIWKI